MAALTLVMNELADLDPEEFFNVRAYHTCGKDFRATPKTTGLPSPTNSESSGVCSLVSSSSSGADDETAAAQKSEEGAKAKKVEEIKNEKEEIKKEEIKEEEVKKEEVKKDEVKKDEVKKEDVKKEEVKKEEVKKEEETKVEEKKNDRIFYMGRDILNLERNTQPFKWQLTSPLFGFLNPYIFVNYRSYYRFDGDFLLEEYPMKTCENCDFQQPSPYS